MEDQLDPKASALLVIDLQNDFVSPQGALARKGVPVAHMGGIVPAVNRLVEVAREAEVPLIWVRVVHLFGDSTPNYLAIHMKSGRDGIWDEADLLACEGRWGAEWVAELIARRPGEVEILKRTYSAFHGTHLDQVLRVRGVRSLILTGCNTNVCLQTTAAEGFFRGYYVLIASDACTSVDREFQGIFLENHRKYYGLTPTVAAIEHAWKR
jgi:ureidoacrylate peracid hydrolase